MIGIDILHLSCRKNKQLNHIHKGQLKHSILYNSVRTCFDLLNFITLNQKIMLRIQVRCRVRNKILFYSASNFTEK